MIKKRRVRMLLTALTLLLSFFLVLQEYILWSKGQHRNTLVLLLCAQLEWAGPLDEDMTLLGVIGRRDWRWDHWNS